MIGICLSKQKVNKLQCSHQYNALWYCRFLHYHFIILVSANITIYKSDVDGNEHQSHTKEMLWQNWEDLGKCAISLNLLYNTVLIAGFKKNAQEKNKKLQILLQWWLYNSTNCAITLILLHQCSSMATCHCILLV